MYVLVPKGLDIVLIYIFTLSIKKSVQYYVMGLRKLVLFMMLYKQENHKMNLKPARFNMYLSHGIKTKKKVLIPKRAKVHNK